MQAVVYYDNKPVLELGADEFVFPILTHDGEHLVLFHLKPCLPAEIKLVYTKAAYSTWTADALLRGIDEREAFLDRHLIKISGLQTTDGVEPSLDEQRSWLKENPQFKVALWESFVDAKFHEVQDVAKRGTILSMAYTQKVKSRWCLYCPERSKEAPIVMTHHFTRLTREDHDRYWKAFKIIEKARGNGLQHRLEADWDVVEQLYDRRVNRLEGAVIDGAPCEEANKRDWIDCVPFPLKDSGLDAAVQQI